MQANISAKAAVTVIAVVMLAACQTATPSRVGGGSGSAAISTFDPNFLWFEPIDRRFPECDISVPIDRLLVETEEYDVESNKYDYDSYRGEYWSARTRPIEEYLNPPSVDISIRCEPFASTRFLSPAAEEVQEVYTRFGNIPRWTMSPRTYTYETDSGLIVHYYYKLEPPYEIGGADVSPLFITGYVDTDLGYFEVRALFQVYEPRAGTVVLPAGETYSRLETSVTLSNDALTVPGGALSPTFDLDAGLAYWHRMLDGIR